MCDGWTDGKGTNFLVNSPSESVFLKSIDTTHCLDIVLEDIRKLSIFYNTIVNAKKITTYIYRHTCVFNLYRQYSKRRELVRSSVTRFATSYLTLNCIKPQKNALRSMFALKE
ncbi:hypothetical protein CR513_41819, partial [Mucuna pruriens]